MGLSIKLLIFLKSLKVAKLHYNASETAKTLKTLKKLVVFQKKYSDFFEEETFLSKKIATGIKFALKCVWTFESSRNVQIWNFLNKTDVVFEKKGIFLKTTKGSKFGVECNSISKISQNFRNLVSSWKNKLVLRKNSWVFLKSLKVANLHYKATKNVRILKTFENLVFFFENVDGSFRQKKSYSSEKMIKAANLL